MDVLLNQQVVKKSRRDILLIIIPFILGIQNGKIKLKNQTEKEKTIIIKKFKEKRKTHKEYNL